MGTEPQTHGTSVRIGNGKQRGEELTELLLSMQRIIGRKWHLVILSRLVADGSKGFNELHDSIDGISSKMLSDSLEELEETGLVDRVVISEKPFRVEYSVTEAGADMETVLTELVAWGRKHA